MSRAANSQTISFNGVCTVALHKNISVLVWHGRADGESAKAATQFTDQLLREHAMFSVVHVLEAGAGLPTPEGRDVLVDVARAQKELIAAVAVLLPADSLIAGLLRSFVRGARTVLRGDLDFIVEQDIAALAEQLAPQHSARSGVRVEAGELVAVIQAARALPR